MENGENLQTLPLYGCLRRMSLGWVLLFPMVFPAAITSYDYHHWISQVSNTTKNYTFDTTSPSDLIENNWITEFSFILSQNLWSWSSQYTFDPKEIRTLSGKINPHHISLFQLYNSSEVEKYLLDRFDRDTKNKARKYLRAILVLAEKYQVDPYWMIAITWTESHFRQSALSRKGARGLMQLMPQTRRYLLKKMQRASITMEVHRGQAYRQHLLPQLSADSERFEVLENLEIGIYYLRNLSERFQSPVYASIAYNMGPSWTRRNIHRKRIVTHNQYLRKVFRYYHKITRFDPAKIGYYQSIVQQSM